MPTINNPTANDLEVPAPYLHPTEPIVIPAGGGVVASLEQAKSLEGHPVLSVRLDIGDDDADIYGEGGAPLLEHAFDPIETGDDPAEDYCVYRENAIDGDCAQPRAAHAEASSELDAGDDTETEVK